MMRIAGRAVGPGEPCLIIAEAGVNHNGDLETALALVDCAAEAGADAVKFQTFRGDLLASPGTRKASYQEASSPSGEDQAGMLRRLELDEASHRAILERCRERGVLFLSTPFDEESADLLERVGVPAFKIGSGELTHHPLLAHVGRKGRPVLLSTGMATLREVLEAVSVLRGAGAGGVALLHCVSAYPTPPEEANLRAIETLTRATGLPVGFSDHTLGTDVALAAAARGACILEKHLTLDRDMEGPDHRTSLEPREFRRMVEGIRRIESSLGDGVKAPRTCERENIEIARRGLHAGRDLGPGETLRREDILVQRPQRGIAPRLLDEIVGRVARRGLKAGEPIHWEDLDPGDVPPKGQE